MRRLFTRIYLHFLGVLLVMSIVVVVIGSLIFRGPVLHGFAERLATHASRLIADRINDPDRLGRIVRNLSSGFEVDMTVRGADGKVIAVAGPELPPPTERDVAHTAEGPSVMMHLHSFTVVSRIVDENGKELGLLQISPRGRFGSFNPLRPIAGIVIVLAVVALGTLPLARRLSRPVDRLIEATRRFGDGDLGYRIPLPSWAEHVTRPDQLLALTREWNRTADRIEKLIGGHRELLANVSHELRSPLTRLRVALELLPRNPETDSRIREIEVDLGELERLVDDVLTTSRLEAAGLPLHKERADLAAIIAAVAERAAHDPALAGKLLVESSASLEVDADAALLKRAVSNLVENAAKYGAAPIRISATRDGEKLVVMIHDAGPGIPPDEREKVFLPFYRADKARTPGTQNGVGLGLTLAKRIVEAHGGTLTLPDGHPRIELPGINSRG